MTRSEAEAHVDHLYGPHWRPPTAQERQAHPMRGMAHDTDYVDPLWPHQDREALVEMFTNPSLSA